MKFDTVEKEIAPITETLGRDHDRLESLEVSAFAARERGDYAAAAELFGHFARGLQRHIVFEENLLFPAFERETGQGADSGPTAVMREEHAQIRSLLEEIAPGMKDPDAPVEQRRQALGAILQEHNMKEEQILYPMTDQALGRERAEELVREIAAFTP